MYKAIVFAGTTEGYELCRFLAENQVSVLGCVATEYGTKSLTETRYLHVQAKRLDQNEMEELFKREHPLLVLDGTHPYAAEVTVNIQKACEKTGVSYVRVLRGKGESQEAVYVESTEAAAEYLKNTEGNVLLTTGSKELKIFTEVPGYEKRLFARVLSLPSVIDTCRELGFEGKNLIAMQGPFSRELNEAMLRQYDCRYLVTKDSGKAGGFMEKLQAAASCHAVPVIIGRPLKEEGITLGEAFFLLKEKFSLSIKPHVTLLGIGMGTKETLTIQGRNAVEKAGTRSLGQNEWWTGCIFLTRQFFMNTEAMRSWNISRITQNTEKW